MTRTNLVQTTQATDKQVSNCTEPHCHHAGTCLLTPCVSRTQQTTETGDASTNEVRSVDCHRLAELANQSLVAIGKELLLRGEFKLAKIAFQAGGMATALEVCTR